MLELNGCKINTFIFRTRGDFVSYRRSDKNGWALFLLVLAGIVLGGFLGELATEVSFLKWLNFGYAFGLKEPLVLDLKVFLLQFKVMFDITIASIIGIIIGILVYRKI